MKTKGGKLKQQADEWAKMRNMKKQETECINVLQFQNVPYKVFTKHETWNVKRETTKSPPNDYRMTIYIRKNRQSTNGLQIGGNYFKL